MHVSPRQWTSTYTAPLMWLSLLWLARLVPYSFPFHYSLDSDFGALKFSSFSIPMSTFLCKPRKLLVSCFNFSLLATPPLSTYIIPCFSVLLSISWTHQCWWLTIDFYLGAWDKLSLCLNHCLLCLIEPMLHIYVKPKLYMYIYMKTFDFFKQYMFSCDVKLLQLLKWEVHFQMQSINKVFML